MNIGMKVLFVQNADHLPHYLKDRTCQRNGSVTRCVNGVLFASENRCYNCFSPGESEEESVFASHIRF